MTEKHDKPAAAASWAFYDIRLQCTCGQTGTVKAPKVNSFKCSACGKFYRISVIFEMSISEIGEAPGFEVEEF